MENRYQNSSLHDVERLALYREQLLPELERREIETRLESDPVFQELDRQLHNADKALQDWGRYHRVRSAVLQANRAPARTDSPSFSPPKSLSFFRPIVAAAALILAVFTVSILMNVSPGDRFAILEQNGEVVLEDISTPDRPMRQVSVAESGSLEVRMGDGKSLAIFKENTVARITGIREMTVDHGTTFHKVADNDRIPYRIVTPHGVVTVLGTVFQVVVHNDKTEVAVERGRVELRSMNGDSEKDRVEKERVIELRSRERAYMQSGGISTPVTVQGRISPWASTTTEITPGDVRDALYR